LRDDIGNYVIKWEIFPQITGSVHMYVSDLPDYFEEETPVGIVGVDEGLTKYITVDNITRKYFLLTFDGKNKEIVGARKVDTDNVENFRDVGGYITKDGRTVKWGNLFRSGHLDAIHAIDMYRLENLGLKTIIDLRASQEKTKESNIFQTNNNQSISVKMGDAAHIKRQLQAGRIKTGDAFLYIQDEYLRFIDEKSEAYAQVLDQLLYTPNYPALIHCSLGIDRTGFCIALILSALGVPEETILKDYMMSNDHVNLNKAIPNARHYNTDIQEVITTLLTADEHYLGVALRKIKKEYGSVDEYLIKKLNFTTKKQERLKELMLY
jgi:protein-tyrosine phosphatase